jgi:hypothetical protein
MKKHAPKEVVGKEGVRKAARRPERPSWNN